MITLEEALSIIDKHVQPFDCAHETIQVTAALGRFLAEDQYSRLCLPPFNKSAMDGFAVLKGDVRDAYQILEIVPAGVTPQQTLKSGTTIKVMTGAPIPEGADRVIPIEQVHEEHSKIKILSPVSPASNIAWCGEDITQGQCLLTQSTFMGPVEIASLITCGITEVPVFKRPRVAIISTGDELVDHYDKLTTTGKIMNTDGPLLQMLCQQQGFEVVLNTTLKDVESDTIQTLLRITDEVDFILFSGGVSVGDFDYVGSALSQAGFIVHFNCVAIKPGRPTTFGIHRNKKYFVFGLPGNPVSVYLAFHLYVMHAIQKAMHQPSSMLYTQLPLAQTFSRKKAEKAVYVPCQLKNDGSLIPIQFNGSGHFTALLHCSGFFVIERSIHEIKAGEKVKFMPLERQSHLIYNTTED